jgi:twinkle protein
MKFIDWNTLTFRKAKGQEKLRCPACDEQRTDKRDRSLLVNHNDGYGKCFYCDALTFKDTGVTSKTDKVYELPPQEWRNFTNLSDAMVQWIWKERGISQPTLNAFEISEEKVYQPAKGKEMNCITFNYFEGETLVNKKFRSAAKDFTQIKGGKPIFYNVNNAIGRDKVYIVEGEFDVLAMYEAGIKNCISLPSGANDNDDYWINSEPYLRDVKQFVIAVDNDDKGIAIREKIAQRLGRYRCTFIEWEGKDANDDLKSGKISDTLKREQRFPIGGTFTSEDLKDDIFALHESGIPETLSPRENAFAGMKEVFSVMRGQLTVVTGIPSHGKSTFTEWYILNLMKDYDLKASFFSPEHSPIQSHMANFIQKAVGKPFFAMQGVNERIEKDDIERFIEWSKERLYITSGGQGEVIDWDWLFERFKEQMFSFGVDVFVIDAFNKVLMPKGMTGKDGIDQILTRLTAFCQQNNVQIFLVAHPTKMQKDKQGNYEVPTLYDVSGSSDFRNQTHNGYTIHRVFPENGQEGYTMFFNMKTKHQYQGKIGETIRFNYHVPSARYYVDGCTPYIFDLTLEGSRPNIDYNPNQYIEPTNLNNHRNEEFDFIPSEECPF